jgi:hypothetical protein
LLSNPVLDDSSLLRSHGEHPAVILPEDFETTGWIDPEADLPTLGIGD